MDYYWNYPIQISEKSYLPDKNEIKWEYTHFEIDPKEKEYELHAVYKPPADKYNNPLYSSVFRITLINSEYQGWVWDKHGNVKVFFGFDDTKWRVFSDEYCTRIELDRNFGYWEDYHIVAYLVKINK